MSFRIIIMSRGVVVTTNAYHVKACNLVHHTDVQVSKKQNVSSLPTPEDLVSSELA